MIGPIEMIKKEREINALLDYELIDYLSYFSDYTLRRILEAILEISNRRSIYYSYELKENIKEDNKNEK